MTKVLSDGAGAGVGGESASGGWSSTLSRRSASWWMVLYGKMRSTVLGRLERSVKSNGPISSKVAQKGKRRASVLRGHSRTTFARLQSVRAQMGKMRANPELVEGLCWGRGNAIGGGWV